jgi:hypothetical protein
VLVDAQSLKETCCVTVRGQLLWPLVDKILVSTAIGTIGAREHNVLPAVFGKSRGVGATGRTRQMTIQSAIYRHWDICQLENFPGFLSIIAKNVPFAQEWGVGN